MLLHMSEYPILYGFTVHYYILTSDWINVYFGTQCI